MQTVRSWCSLARLSYPKCLSYPSPIVSKSCPSERQSQKGRMMLLKLTSCLHTQMQQTRTLREKAGGAVCADTGDYQKWLYISFYYAASEEPFSSK